MGQSQSEEVEDHTEAGERNEGVRLYKSVDDKRWPIIYSSNYDISFFRLERLHPFDSSKWRRVFELLQQTGMLKGTEDTIEPLEADEQDLLTVHTREYLDSLRVCY